MLTCDVQGGFNYKSGGFQRTPHHTLNYEKIYLILRKKGKIKNDDDDDDDDDDDEVTWATT